MPAKLSLKSRKNLRDNEAKRDEYLARIGAATDKKDVVYEMDDAAVDEALNTARYTNRIGEICYDKRLAELTEKIEKLCADEMTKEALNEAWTTNKIIFDVDPSNGVTGFHQHSKFADGNLVMMCKAEEIFTNIGEIGDEIEGQL